MLEHQRRASRRPSVPLLVVAALLIAFGLWQGTQPVRCGDDVMLPGDSCLVLNGNASDTLSYDESVANHQRNPYILVAAGVVVALAGVAAGFVLAGRVDSPRGQAERLAWEGQIAGARRRVVADWSSRPDPAGEGPRALADLDRRAAKERRSRRYPPPAAPSRGAAGPSTAVSTSGVTNTTSGVGTGPSRTTVGPPPRRGSRRPVIRLVLLAAVLFAVGLVLWGSTEPRCRGEQMAPGATCSTSTGRTMVERTAEQMLQTQRAPARVLMGAAGVALVASVGMGLYRGRRSRAVSEDDQRAWRAEISGARASDPPAG